MHSLCNQLADMLRHWADLAHRSRLPSGPATTLERLACEADQPCLVAIVGRVKAGKSTFLNALLGQDLAVVGATETTATINYFRHGQPTDPTRPIRCHWRNGDVTDETFAFLKSLQGHDAETLRRAEEIDHLEHLLPLPLLQRVTLVDTPGTCAAVAEHQSRTDDFLALAQRLRERHHLETERFRSQADAVIYLVGAVARSSDRDFLAEYHHSTGGGESRPWNALGVLAKVDLSPELLAERHRLASRITSQLSRTLHSVYPVSAALARAVQELLARGGLRLGRLLEVLRRVPESRLPMLLDDFELFTGLELPEGPTSEERQEIVANFPWRAFATIAWEARLCGFRADALVSRLQDLAGFESLQLALDRLFLRRGRLLRCYRITCEARTWLNEVRYRYIGACRRQGELVHADLLQAMHGSLDLAVSTLHHALEAANEDFLALRLVEESTELFSAAEAEELRQLLGHHGWELEERLPTRHRQPSQLRQRQQHWRTIMECDRRAERRTVAERAVAVYGQGLEL